MKKILMFLALCAVLNGCSNPRFVLIYEDGETADKSLTIGSTTTTGVTVKPAVTPTLPPANQY